MKIKNFVAADVENALTQINKEIGQSALILEIRRNEEKGFKRFLGKKIVNVAAAYTEDVVNDTFGSVLNDVLSNNGVGGANKDSLCHKKSVNVDHKTSAKMLLLLNESKKRGINVTDGDKDGSDVTFDRFMPKSEVHGFGDCNKSKRINGEFDNFILEDDVHEVSDLNKPKKSHGKFDSFLLESETSGLKDLQMTNEIIEETESSENTSAVIYTGLKDELEKIRTHLNCQQVKVDITDSLLKRWESIPIQRQESLNVKSIRSDIQSRIANLIRVEDILGNYSVTDNKKVITFVGPTGVGKTTTLAKVAAKLVLDGKKSVGIITMDTYKVAAVEQMAVFAERIDTPVRVANTSDELLAVVNDFKDKDFILIDTVGRSQYDDKKIKILMAALENLPLLETYLVVGAGTMYKDAEDIFNSFSIVPLNGFIFTKVDETKCFGTMLNISETTRLPICCITNGQEVPGDILKPDPKWIASLIFSL